VAWRGYKARKENRANKVFPGRMVQMVTSALRAQTELPELPVLKAIPARQVHRENKA
jgi:hypothetical protein